MKDLFRNHFPFVEGIPEEELTPEQLIIKQTYDKLYPTDSICVDPVAQENSGSDTKTKTKRNRLREVHVNESPVAE